MEEEMKPGRGHQGQIDDITGEDDATHKPKDEPPTKPTPSPSPSSTGQAGMAPGAHSSQGSQPTPSNKQEPAPKEPMGHKDN